VVGYLVVIEGLYDNWDYLYMLV